MLLLFSLFAAIKSRLTAANQEMIDKIIKKYSTYFEEFKTNSGECCYYYVFFVFRRIAIILLIFLIPQKEIQLSISLSMALAVIYM